MDLIERAEELLSKATPGKWMAYINRHGSEVATGSSPNTWICQLWYKDEETMQNHENNAVLIAESPTLIRGLIDLVKQQQEIIAHYKKISESYDSLMAVIGAEAYAVDGEIKRIQELINQHTGGDTP